MTLELFDFSKSLKNQGRLYSTGFSWVWQFDGKNSVFSEYKYWKIILNPGFLRLKS
ncbi:hypothetical protein Q3V20_03105 [Mesomycoplasma ovipneumoniae]|uniref:hypothetical protein n=1 Tax=Mesomycoplasma ovipneumoniae TaxID=29562 RepID=UPI0026DC262B|nr:hypothetical protein [Mesomycoplasma ovipneumoniae]MDO4158000.1 hypothetical protein [Mesomycoplasma ovipneumoniae]MDO4158155.1 hypothetical protein [Mesomycoplasma ovipneumoniae]MDO6829865.1 hypothetical protein [Mesomycoplasma ovipneumoniae]